MSPIRKVNHTNELTDTFCWHLTLAQGSWQVQIKNRMKHLQKQNLS